VGTLVEGHTLLRRSTSTDYLEGTHVGAPLPPLRFEVNGVNERTAPDAIDNEMVTGHLPNPFTPVV
jgi:hypothetical protein